MNDKAYYLLYIMPLIMYYFVLKSINENNQAGFILSFGFCIGTFFIAIMINKTIIIEKEQLRRSKILEQIRKEDNEEKNN